MMFCIYSFFLSVFQSNKEIRYLMQIGLPAVFTCPLVRPTSLQIAEKSYPSPASVGPCRKHAAVAFVHTRPFTSLFFILTSVIVSRSPCLVVTGHLQERQIAYVCRETLNGLHYLHTQSMMHRDIKVGIH